MVVGNWKLNGDNAFLSDYLRALLSQLPLEGLPTPFVLCPPVILLAALKIHLQQLQAEFPQAAHIQLGAQDVSEFSMGAFTGETSAEQLVDQGCSFVIIGHSERRQYQHESNELISKKIHRALQAGLMPIVCIGETLAQREQQQTFAILAEQLTAVPVAELILAYEPVWAIGTGKTAAVEQVVEVHQWIQQSLAQNQQKSVAVLYGGSVKPDNAPQLFAQASVSGGLIGGCSLDPQALALIYQAAVQAS
jgi:triosephosphate isomerase